MSDSAAAPAGNPHLSNEAQIVFRTAGGRENDGALCDLLAQPLKWDRVSFMAERETASSVMWRRLSALPCAGASAAAKEIRGMQQLALVSEFHLMHLQQRLEEAVGAIAAAGVDVLLLKGAGLAYTAYADFSQRPMSDIDLLIDAARADEVRALLANVGWDWDKDESAADKYERHHHLPPLRYDHGIATTLELHTELFVPGSPMKLSAADILRTAKRISVGGQCALVPSPQYQLLHACLHFGWSHAMRSGAWRTFRDVGAIIETGQVDWGEFVRLARESRGGTCCYWTFRLAADMGGVTGIPAEVLSALRPPQPDFVMRRVERHFTSQLSVFDATCPSEALSRMVWVLGVMPERSGHGHVRPWDQLAEMELEQNQGAAYRWQKMTHHLRNLGQWVRYARMMLTPSAS